jgi:iron complex outermembrane receptor protein
MDHCQLTLLFFSVTLGASSIALGAAPAVEHNAARNTWNETSPMAGVLEEILVSARRRNESSMAVPMSLTVLDGETLDGLQYRDVDAFLGFSPGVLVYTGSDGLSSQIVIRGVLTPGTLVETGNAVYVDEVYSSGLHTILPGFYDIASVQVLKGPQAGLYGRNTTGGAVVITTAQPTDELFARLDTSYAEYGDYDVSGTVNAPLSDTLRMRATGWYNDRDGGYYQSGVDGDNLDALSEAGGRLTVALLPNERMSLTLSTEYVEIDHAYGGFAGVVKGAQLAAPPVAPESRRNVLRDDLDGPDQHISRVYSRLDLDTGAGSFVAVAGWRDLKVRVGEADFDGTAYAASYADFLARGRTRPLLIRAPQVYTLDDRDQTVDAEVRFLTPDNGSPLQAIVGASYFDESARFHYRRFPVRDFALILADIGEDGSFTQGTNLDTRSWAGFTELLWTPLDTIELTADLRYTRDRKHIDYRESATGYYAPSQRPGSYTLDTSETFDNWSPGITLAYKPKDSLTLFAKYVRGFRAGGFNTRANDPALLSYDSEKAENYELGIKALLLDGRLELGASAFYLRLNNALLPRPDPGEIEGLSPYQNAGVSETTGLEIDLTSRITEGLSLSASGGAYHNSLSEMGGLGLNRYPYVPKYTASLAANYEHPLADTIMGIARLGFRHRSGGIVPAPGRLDMDSYHLLDAQLGIRFGRAELAAFVRNALDDHYVAGNYGLILGQYEYVYATGLDIFTTRALVRDPGRVFGVRMTLMFL